MVRQLSANILHFLYNSDRAIASLFGAPPQETISSEVGRRASRDPFARALTWALNKIEPGHTDKAISHATKLDNADDGVEK